MTGPIDTGLGFYRQVLDLRAYRQQILSADIANASTPGFKAVDLDFKEALAGAMAPPAPTPTDTTDAPDVATGGLLWLVSDARDMVPRRSAPEAAASAVKYQASSQVTLDGNSVDLQQEKVTAAANAVDYEAATTFTQQTIKMLLTAINGSQSGQTNGG